MAQHIHGALYACLYNILGTQQQLFLVCTSEQATHEGKYFIIHAAQPHGVSTSARHALHYISPGAAHASQWFEYQYSACITVVQRMHHSGFGTSLGCFVSSTLKHTECIDPGVCKKLKDRSQACSTVASIQP
eukprot:1161202-Pelagomonas_calceolata.AAC.1